MGNTPEFSFRVQRAGTVVAKVDPLAGRSCRDPHLSTKNRPPIAETTLQCGVNLIRTLLYTLKQHHGPFQVNYLVEFQRDGPLRLRSAAVFSGH